MMYPPEFDTWVQTDVGNGRNEGAVMCMRACMCVRACVRASRVQQGAGVCGDESTHAAHA